MVNKEDLDGLNFICMVCGFIFPRPEESPEQHVCLYCVVDGTLKAAVKLGFRSPEHIYLIGYHQPWKRVIPIKDRLKQSSA